MANVFSTWRNAFCVVKVLADFDGTLQNRSTCVQSQPGRHNWWKPHGNVWNQSCARHETKALCVTSTTTGRVGIHQVSFKLDPSTSIPVARHDVTQVRRHPMEIRTGALMEVRILSRNQPSLGTVSTVKSRNHVRRMPLDITCHGGS